MSMNDDATKFSMNHTSYNNDVGQAACLNVHIEMNDSGCLSHTIDQHQFSEASDSREELTHGSSEQLQLSTSVNQDANKCILDSDNNSANSKVTSL